MTETYWILELFTALTIHISVGDGSPASHCSATAVGPRTIYTAQHCLAHWDGSWIYAQRQGVKTRYNVSVTDIRCNWTHVAKHLHGVSDVSQLIDEDGTCELTLADEAPDFKASVPPCLGEWASGQSGTVVHTPGLQAEMTTACLEDRDGDLMWSSCSDDSIVHGSSGAGLVVNGCLAGVLLVMEKGNFLYSDRYMFSALKPPAKPVAVPAVTVTSAKP